MPPKLNHIDTGFYEISAADAKRYAGTLPALGYSKDIEIDGQKYRLLRTMHDGKQVWAVFQPASLFRNKENESMEDINRPESWKRYEEKNGQLVPDKFGMVMKDPEGGVWDMFFEGNFSSGEWKAKNRETGEVITAIGRRSASQDRADFERQSAAFSKTGRDYAKTHNQMKAAQQAYDKNEGTEMGTSPVKDKINRYYSGTIAKILTAIYDKVDEDLFDDLISRMIYYKFTNKLGSSNDIKSTLKSLWDFIVRNFSDKPTQKLVPLLNALKDSGVSPTMVKEYIVRREIRKVVEESLYEYSNLGGVLQPKFDYKKMNLIAKRAGNATLMIFADNRQLSVEAITLEAIYGSDENGKEYRIPYDHIEFVEVGGKRITKEDLGRK